MIRGQAKFWMNQDEWDVINYVRTKGFAHHEQHHCTIIDA